MHDYAAIKKRNGIFFIMGKSLKPIYKMWIRVHGKARVGEKAEHTR
jgi:hypothetical protein